MKLLFFIFAFVLCACAVPIPSVSRKKNLCYEYRYDKKSHAWRDEDGNIQECSIYDYEHIFPTVRNQCRHWESHFPNSKLSDEESYGLRVNFQKIILNRQAVCLKQKYIEHGDQTIPLGDTPYCIISDEGDFYLEKCP